MLDHLLHPLETESSVTLLALALAGVMLACRVLDREHTLHRTILLAVAAFLAIRYAWWRGTETLAPWGLTWDFVASWLFFAIEAGALLSSLSAFVILSRTVDRRSEATRFAGWWEGDAPRAAVLIATYNEDREVLERTIVGAKALDYPDYEVLVLDDGRRDWLRDFAAEEGVRYVRRDDNRDSKAGNINNALRLLAEEPSRPDFVAVLDADFVPHSDFLTRCLALFHDPSVGLVQTPQHFFNADPIQHNLGLSKSYPDEQRFFFDHLQPSRDAWGIAFCCGTSSVIRWTALEEIGGFPTESVTEDFLLTLTLQDAGFGTVYLCEPLTEGLAPEGLKEYVTQRARWCLGLMQIARGRMGPFSASRLRLRDRWSVVDSVLFWTTTFTFRLAALVVPLFYWFFNITVVNASVPDVISYFGVYFVWTLMTLNFVSGGMVLPVVNDVSQLLGAIPITRAAFTGLIQPKGHPFRVTAKGGDRTRIVVQWRMLAPFAVLLTLSLVGLFAGIVSERFAFNDAGDGKAVILFWTIYNLFVLAFAIIVCVELPRRERHLDAPELATIRYDGEEIDVWITSLTQNSVRVRGEMIPEDRPVVVSIRGVGDIEAVVSQPTEDGARLLLSADMAQHDALIRRFYANGEAPGVTRTSYGAIIEDLGRRLSFSSRR